MSKLNLGRARGDNAGSQNATLNSVKPAKAAFPKFTGKNAAELNALAQFIEDKFKNAHDFERDIASKEVDTTLERLHTAMLKLQEASDDDNDELAEQLKASITEQVQSIIASEAASSESKKDKEDAETLTDEDKEYLKDLIAASTLTQAAEKTSDQTGENGLTKDDISRALDSTMERQQTLNNDVVAAAKEASSIVEQAGSSSDVRDELEQMFSENKPDDSAAGDFQKQSTASFDKLQDLVSSQLGKLQAHISIVGENFKNSPAFNYKNPFTGSVGKLPTVVESLEGAFGSLNDKVQAGIEGAKLPFEKVSDLFGKSQDYMASKIADVSAAFGKVGDAVSGFKDSVAKKIDTVKTGMKNVAMAPVKLVSNGLAKMKDAVTSPFKKLNPFKKKDKSKDGKKKPKKSLFGSLLGKLFKPKLVNLAPRSFGIIFKGIRQQLTALQKRLLKKGKLKGMMLPAVPAAPMISPKEKKEKKQRGKLFDNVGKFMKKIGDIFKNIVTHILAILDQIIVGLCKAIAKGIGIILRAIFMSPWGLIILASLLLISVGILLISLAVKKLVDYIVDDLGPIIKEKLKMINPETLNKFVEKVTNFIDVFTSIIAGIFAPVIAIGKLVMAIIKPLSAVVGAIARVLGKILVPIIEAIGSVIMSMIKPILEVIKGIVLTIINTFLVVWRLLLPVINFIINTLMGIVAVVGPILDIVGGVIMDILEGIGEVLEIITPIIREVVGVVIKAAVETIRLIVSSIMTAISMVWDFLCAPAKLVMSIIKGVGNWLAGFADKEIGVWKFKFKPFGFLKGLKTEPVKDEDMKVDDGKAQEVIDSLNSQLKELQGSYAKAQEEIKTLQEKLKDAMSVTIGKKEIMDLLSSSRLSAKRLKHSVIPRLKTIITQLKKISSSMKSFIEAAKKMQASPAEPKVAKGAALVKPPAKAAAPAKKSGGMLSFAKKALNAATIPLMLPGKAIRLAATDAVAAVKKVTSLVSKPAKLPAKVEAKVNASAGKDIQLVKKSGPDLIKKASPDFIKKGGPELVKKGGPELVAKKPQLDIAPASVKEQFKPITSINTKPADDSKSLSEGIQEVQAETAAASSDDLTNTDLKTFLMKMFENIDISFQKISEKLDNPQVIPMPSPMNISNQALIGTD